MRGIIPEILRDKDCTIYFETESLRIYSPNSGFLSKLELNNFSFYFYFTESCILKLYHFCNNFMLKEILYILVNAHGVLLYTCIHVHIYM